MLVLMKIKTGVTLNGHLCDETWCDDIQIHPFGHQKGVATIKTPMLPDLPNKCTTGHDKVSSPLLKEKIVTTQSYVTAYVNYKSRIPWYSLETDSVECMMHR